MKAKILIVAIIIFLIFAATIIITKYNFNDEQANEQTHTKKSESSLITKDNSYAPQTENSMEAKLQSEALIEIAKELRKINKNLNDIKDELKNIRREMK